MPFVERVSWSIRMKLKNRLAVHLDTLLEDSEQKAESLRDLRKQKSCRGQSMITDEELPKQKSYRAHSSWEVGVPNVKEPSKKV